MYNCSLLAALLLTAFVPVPYIANSRTCCDGIYGGDINCVLVFLSCNNPWELACAQSSWPLESSRIQTRLRADASRPVSNMDVLLSKISHRHRSNDAHRFTVSRYLFDFFRNDDAVTRQSDVVTGTLDHRAWRWSLNLSERSPYPSEASQQDSKRWVYDGRSLSSSTTGAGLKYSWPGDLDLNQA